MDRLEKGRREEASDYGQMDEGMRYMTNKILLMSQF